VLFWYTRPELLATRFLAKRQGLSSFIYYLGYLSLDSLFFWQQKFIGVEPISFIPIGESEGQILSTQGSILRTAERYL
jgi:hypothetical protein